MVFSIGVPVKHQRSWLTSLRQARARLIRWLRIWLASSSTTRNHLTKNRGPYSLPCISSSLVTRGWGGGWRGGGGKGGGWGGEHQNRIRGYQPCGPCRTRLKCGNDNIVVRQIVRIGAAVVPVMDQNPHVSPEDAARKQATMNRDVRVKNEGLFLAGGNQTSSSAQTHPHCLVTRAKRVNSVDHWETRAMGTTTNVRSGGTLS